MRINKQKVCSHCPCFNLINSCCNLTDTINELPCDTVIPDCPLPLVSVPKIHGRLVDTDNLHRCIKAMLSDSDVIAVFESIIQCQPTIIEAEVSE